MVKSFLEGITMPIDDPYHMIEQQHKEESDPIFEKVMELFSQIEPMVGVVNTIRKVFSKDASIARVNALLGFLIPEVRRIEGETDKLTKRLESPELAETVIVTINETIRTTDLEKIRRFAAILGHTLTTERKTSWDDAAAYIRDIAQLGDRDIKALQILYSVQKDLFLGRNLALDPKSYTEKNGEVLKLAHESGMPRDDFYSRCSRLNGFGLAIEVQRNDARVSPNDHCFRLTTRGRELVSIISG
jgi:hypothetical protein